VGAPLTFVVWILALVTHDGARYAGPAWLAVGLVLFVLVRRSERHGLLEQVLPVEELPAGAEFGRILVPLKLGDIGEEMVATAIALALKRNAEVEAIPVVRVPGATRSRATAAGGRRRAWTRRSRRPGRSASTRRRRAHGTSCGEVDRARDRRRGVDARRRPRRHGLVRPLEAASRFFSPTVDFVLRRAPCEVLVVAFPEGVFQE
jgi:nucleotide-binding universal stress UspA family protein